MLISQKLRLLECSLLGRPSGQSCSLRFTLNQRCSGRVETNPGMACSHYRKTCPGSNFSSRSRCYTATESDIIRGHNYLVQWQRQQVEMGWRCGQGKSKKDIWTGSIRDWVPKGRRIGGMETSDNMQAQIGISRPKIDSSGKKWGRSAAASVDPDL